MLIGGDDISNDVITLGTCLFTFALVSVSPWLAEIWQLSRQGATGELEMEFKFQGRSCKLSFLFPPCRHNELDGRDTAPLRIKLIHMHYITVPW